MEIEQIIMVAFPAFAMGIYLASQLSIWIEKNTKK